MPKKDEVNQIRANIDPEAASKRWELKLILHNKTGIALGRIADSALVSKAIKMYHMLAVAADEGKETISLEDIDLIPEKFKEKMKK